MEVKNQLAGTAEAISDAAFKNHIFTTLPTMFDVIVIILQARADATLQEVQDALKEHKQNQVMLVKPDAVAEALYSQRGRGGRGGQSNKGKERPQKWCDSCKMRSHNTIDCWYTQKNNNNKRPQERMPTCYYCAEEGYTRVDSPTRKKATALRNHRTAQEQEGNGQGGNGSAPNPTGNQQ